MIKAACVAQSP